ncbi:MAG: TolC family protein [Fidelibacterota bacterium]|nr:MAG: TolC family protein [Candidatus Neomarinimicrobiota bacterium]
MKIYSHSQLFLRSDQFQESTARRFLFRFVFLVAAAFSAGSSVWAQPMGSLAHDPASIDELLTAGHASNPELQATYYRWQAAQEEIPARRALPDPTIGYVHYLESVETRVGPQEGAANLSQRLPWFGKLRLEGRIGRAKAAAAFYQYHSAVQRVSAEIAATYWHFLYLQQSIRITEQNLELLRDWERVALSKYTTAQAGHPDIIKAQIEVLSLEDRLESLKQRLGPLARKLSAAVGRPLTVEDIAIGAFPVYQLPSTLDSLQNELSQNNPELLAQETRTEAGQLAYRRSKLNYLPDFILGGNLILTGENPALGNNPENGKDPVMISLGLSLPIHLKKNRALKQAARAQWRSAELSAHNIANRLRSQMELALYEFQDALRKVRLYQEALIPRAEQAVSAAEAAYIGDKVDFLTLIDAQRVYLDYQLSLQRALADQAIQYSQIKALLGRYVPEAHSQEEN